MALESRPNQAFPEAVVRDELSRLHRDPPAADQRLGPASHPLADIRRAAILWRKLGPALHDIPDEAIAPETPGPAALALEAAKFGLEVDCRRWDAPRLDPADLPAIVLLRAGGSRLVAGLLPDGRCRVATAQGESIVAAADLRASATGSIITVREAKEADGEEMPQAAQASSEARQAGGRLIWRHLRRELGASGGHLRQLVLASALINLFGLLLPLFSMAVFDRIIPHSAMETLWALALGVTAALVLELAVRNARLRLFDAVGQSASQGLQATAMGKLLHAPVADLPARSGAAVQPLQELDQLAMLAPQLIVSLAVDLPFFILLMLLIGSIGGPVVIAPLVGTLLLVLLHVFAHVMAHRSAQAHGGLVRRLQQFAIDGIAAQERIRLTGSARRMLSGFERTADEAGYAAHRSRYWHGLAAQGSAVITQLVIVVTIVVGVFLIDAAAMTIGALSACILLVNRSMTPVSIATGLSFRLLQILQSAGVLAALLDLKPESGGDQSLTAEDGIEGCVTLQNVSFRYPGEARPALSSVSFAMKPGERIGIIGKAGCGKSTLLRLIARLHDADEGRIQLDHRDIRQFDPSLVRRAIGYMPQDAQLVDGTLEENLTLGLSGLDRAVFAHVAAACGVHDFASRNPAGYSLQVGPGGRRLSGGERQCVSLARALMGQPKLVMLDEPTAALDNMLEAKVVADLRGLIGGAGLILATHRLPALELVDRIIWIEDGRIVADGPKAEMFQRLGLAASKPAAQAAAG
jgi:ATP-binding cassette, subfamily C, bacterial LapB